MDSDYSDLTDLDDFEDDGDYGKGKKAKSNKTTKGAASSGYRIRHALKVPRATTYTAQALYGAFILASTSCGHSKKTRSDP